MNIIDVKFNNIDFKRHKVNVFYNFVSMNQLKNFPSFCPACSAKLHVSELSCDQCETKIQGHFVLPQLLGLSKPEQEFILAFLQASGSLKEMSKILGFSYPKVRNMLDELILKVKKLNDEKNTA